MKLKVKTNINNYSVIIGKNLCSRINKIILDEKIYSEKFLLVYDSKVPIRMIKSIVSRFNKKIIVKKKIVFNEKKKNLKTVSSIVKILEKKNFSRNDCLISVGGGICGDVCGFSSSIFKRGLNFINVPTTLLSQVDSSIGGKTGVNSLSGKNMIGSFYQPSLVISDIDFLKSLPKKEMICGYAEILKHSLIKNKTFFKFLKKNFYKIMDHHHKFLERAIYKSCIIKKKIVEKDEKEKNIRKVLNLGHTFAHAYEATIGYNKSLNHGEAVLLGIMSAVEFSLQKNILKKNDYEQIINHLKILNYYNLNRYFKSKDISKIIFYMRQDKKNKGNKINLILLKGISKPVLSKSFKENNIKSFLKNLIYR
tara:strand:- start:393 stop:1487 length:1095 start_codon:yes stop_codon:yes gene_type:complete